MNLHITRSYTAQNPTAKRLERHWRGDIAVGVSPYQLTFYQAQYKEKHPELLRRVLREILKVPGKHLISELDFIVFPGGLETLEKELDSYRAIFVPWNNRESHGPINVCFPMTAPWLMAFNTENAPPLPEDLFDTLGKPFDVACPTLIRVLECGFCGPHQVLFHDAVDAKPLFDMYSTLYEGIGLHCFYERTFACEPDHQLGNVEGTTLQSHLDGIDWVLRELGRGCVPKLRQVVG